MAAPRPLSVTERLHTQLLRVDVDDGARLLRSAGLDGAVAALRALESGHQASLLEHVGPERRRDLLTEMPSDERARVFADNAGDDRWVDELATEEREVTLRLLRYPPESVGRMMTLLEVLQLEEAEDTARTSGVDPLRQPYLAASLLRLVRTRAVWLVVAATAGVLTVRVLDHFEDALAQVVALALFIPLLLGTGGNIGAQAATTVVRAMAVDDLRLRDLTRVVWREASVGVMLGGLLAVLAAVPIAIVYEPKLATVVSLTLLSVCVIGTSAGSVLPLVVGRVGGDPAVVSAPFITTLVDATGLLVYFVYARGIFGV